MSDFCFDVSWLLVCMFLDSLTANSIQCFLFSRHYYFIVIYAQRYLNFLVLRLVSILFSVILLVAIVDDNIYFLFYLILTFYLTQILCLTTTKCKFLTTLETYKCVVIFKKSILITSVTFYLISHFKSLSVAKSKR